MTGIGVEGWKFKGKTLVVKEPQKKNEPNSERTICKSRLTSKPCTKKEWTTDTDTCNNKGESQEYYVK